MQTMDGRTCRKNRLESASLCTSGDLIRVKSDQKSIATGTRIVGPCRRIVEIFETWFFNIPTLLFVWPDQIPAAPTI